MVQKLDINKIIIIILLVFTYNYANIDVTVQNKWDKKALISTSYIKNIKRSRHYVEVGFNFIPAKNVNKPIVEGVKENRFEFDSYYGMATGYYFGITRWLRSGIHFGIGYERFKRYSNINNKYSENGYRDWDATPYFGFGLQIGIASFIISNEGIGGGINFVIGGRN